MHACFLLHLLQSFSSFEVQVTVPRPMKFTLLLKRHTGCNTSVSCRQLVACCSGSEPAVGYFELKHGPQPLVGYLVVELNLCRLDQGAQLLRTTVRRHLL